MENTVVAGVSKGRERSRQSEVGVATGGLPRGSLQSGSCEYCDWVVGTCTYHMIKIM